MLLDVWVYLWSEVGVGWFIWQSNSIQVIQGQLLKGEMVLFFIYLHFS